MPEIDMSINRNEALKKYPVKNMLWRIYKRAEDKAIEAYEIMHNRPIMGTVEESTQFEKIWDNYVKAIEDLQKARKDLKWGLEEVL